MPANSLLVSSLQYGVVARSYPLTGKVLSGFLDASGTRTGLGIGNPNAEFTPNVSVCVLASDAGTAKIIWGFRNGEVAVATASKAMDAVQRPAIEVIRCTADDQHEGAVLDAVWADELNAVMVTAGADGLVKVWDAKKVRCLWTSEKNPKTLAPDACVKVSAAICHGYVVGVMRSGDVVVWSGLNLQSLDADAIPISAHEARIPHMALAVTKNDKEYGAYDTVTLHVDIHAPSPTALVAYPDDPHFHQLRIEEETGNIKVTSFGDSSFGPIATLSPFFSASSSFVLVGDHMGSVSVYDWHALHNSFGTTIHPTKQIEVHEDGSSVTALAWNGVTLITGSARGTVHVWDALTFDHLRSFMSPVPRVHRRGATAQAEERDRKVVTQILIGPEKDVLMASIGDRVLAWKAGPVLANGSGVKSRHSTGEAGKKKKDKGAAKYLSV